MGVRHFPNTVLLTPPPSEGELPLDSNAEVVLSEACDTTKPAVFERKMGDTELSYFLPSRQTGVNDMYGSNYSDCVALCSCVPQVPAPRFPCPCLTCEAFTSAGSMGNLTTPSSVAVRQRRDARL